MQEWLKMAAAIMMRVVLENRLFAFESFETYAARKNLNEAITKTVERQRLAAKA